MRGGGGRVGIVGFWESGGAVEIGVKRGVERGIEKGSESEVKRETDRTVKTAIKTAIKPLPPIPPHRTDNIPIRRRVDDLQRKR
jgi:hypothetical protein